MKQRLDEYEEWLLRELIKTYDEEQYTKNEIVVKLKYKDLIRMFSKFIRMIREWYYEHWKYVNQRYK